MHKFSQSLFSFCYISTYSFVGPRSSGLNKTHEVDSDQRPFERLMNICLLFTYMLTLRTELKNKKKDLQLGPI